MSKAKWFVVRKPSTGEIIAISANQICATEIPWRYKNVVLYSSWNVDGGLGTRLDRDVLNDQHLAVGCSMTEMCLMISILLWAVA